VFFSTAPGTGTNAQSSPLKSSTEFALYRQMFDQFRVHSVSVKVIPKITQTESTAMAQLQEQSTITVGKAVYYTVVDRDGPVLSSVSAIKKYSSHRVHKITSTATRTFAVKYDGKDQWFDCQNINDMEDVQKSLGLWGGISVYAESLPEKLDTIINPVWADVEISYRMSFRGKALVGISVNAQDGSVTLTQPDSEDLDPVLVLGHLDNVPHLGAIDLCGNVITGELL